MRSAIALLSVCVFLCHSVNAGDDIDEDCKQQMKEVKQTMNQMIEDDTIPQCAKDNEMTQFKCTAGEDPEKDKEMEGKFKEWFSALDEEKQKEVMECAKEVMKKVHEKRGKEITEDCRKQLKEMHDKMLAEE